MALLRYTREVLSLGAVLRDLARNRQLIRSMVVRDFVGRYRGSFIGLYWSIINPLVLMALYTIVFSVFLKVRFSTDDSPIDFALYLLCAMLPWNAFAEGLTRSANVIRENANLVKRVVFPLEILPLNLALSAMIHEVIGLVLLTALIAIINKRLYWTLLMVPLLLGIQLLFAVGMNWVTASLGVFLRDILQMIGLVLTAWMFLTPIFYPENVVPARLQIVLWLNPMARLVRYYRMVLLGGSLPDPVGLAALAIGVMLVFLFGYFWFSKTKSMFADVV